MNKQTLDRRLLLAAELVRPGAHFADVGTDHAYLPLYLLDEGKIASAVASDVAAGPLARAEENVLAAGREGEITLRLSNGLSGMESLGLTDIAICGMGGEMIAAILAAAPFIRDPAVRLILQPMTRADVLRQYLAEEGFAVFAERYAAVGGHVYLCLGVTFDGVRRALGRVDAVLGDSHARDPRDAAAFSAFLAALERDACARMRGKRIGGADVTEEEELLAAIAAERKDTNDGKGVV